MISNSFDYSCNSIQIKNEDAADSFNLLFTLSILTDNSKIKIIINSIWNKNSIIDIKTLI